VVEWDGPTDHFAEDRMLGASRDGDEIHVFYRLAQRDPFEYLGQCRVVNCQRHGDHPLGCDRDRSGTDVLNSVGVLAGECHSLADDCACTSGSEATHCGITAVKSRLFSFASWCSYPMISQNHLAIGEEQSSEQLELLSCSRAQL